MLNRFPDNYRILRALGLVLALALLVGSVATVHLHEDGFAHYADCDSCLQIQLQSGVAATNTTLPVSIERPAYRAVNGQQPHTQSRTGFAARAPPYILI